MRLRITCLIALCTAITIFAHGQSKVGLFIHPMQIEPKLSANFGEIRKNHFHSGLDYRTEQRIGIPVYAAEDGYLVRIFVSPGGFGKALYINHGDRYTSVYAHLDAFSPEIERYVKTRQYANESFAINDFPNRDFFKFKKGDLIGYSGNSGSSGGPHLHFEIRDQLSEEPLNPLGMGLLFIEDATSPKIKSTIIYQQDTVKGVPVPSIFTEVGTISNADTVAVPRSFFIGVECADYMPNTTNEYLVKRFEVLVDSTTVYNFDMLRFAFNETRFINSVIDFVQYNTSRREIIRAYKEPNNTFSVLAKQKSNGVIHLSDDKPHRITVFVEDSNGNSTNQEFWVKGTASLKKTISTASLTPIYYNKRNSINRAAAKISIPGESIYQSLLIDYKEQPNPKGFGKVIVVGNRLQPLSKPIEVAIRCELPASVAEKAFVARGTSTSFTPLGGVYENGYLTTTSSEFGRFFIDIDNQAPTIKPQFKLKKEKAPANGILGFNVVDDKTGIDSYDIYIDGKWVVGEYDPKYNLVFVKLDEERIGKDRHHELEFYVADGVGNTSYFKCSFYF